MIQVPRLLEQEDVGKPQEEERGAQSVEKAQHDEECEGAERVEMDVHPVARPRTNPLEERVGEVVAGLEPVARDPIVIEVTLYLPEHHEPERHAEEDDTRDVDWAKERGGQAMGRHARRLQAGL